ncbi:MAG: DUF2752 domain-containing protein [Eubacterium sp.]|nr:DUF2752 domain-containing protein [Eubacterium sp.]
MDTNDRNTVNTSIKKTAWWKQADSLIYGLSCLLIAGLIVMCVLQFTGRFSLTDDLHYPCAFRRATGLYCPGCGGSHALTAMLSGHLIDSFLAHPFVLYLTGCALVDVIGGTIALIRHRALPRFRPLYAYIGIAILLLQWIVKNILLLLD